MRIGTGAASTAHSPSGSAAASGLARPAPASARPPTASTIPASKTAPKAPVSSASASDAIRVVVVDDAVVVRGMISRWMAEEEGVTVVASHRNGKVAVDAAVKDAPHVIILDIEMPEMDGMEALPLLLKACPKASIIMASTLTRRNAEISLKALSLGAADYVPKPQSNCGISTSAEFRRELTQKVRALGDRSMRRQKFNVAGQTPAAQQAGASARVPASKPIAEPAGAEFSLRPLSNARPRLLVIGSSTGGPPALSRLMNDLDKSVFAAVPVLVTQHMPASFTAILAEHMGRASGIETAEAIHGEAVRAGRIYVAPGGKHMMLDGRPDALKIRLTDDPPIHFCKPAVDPLFASAAQIMGSHVLGVVLTGMGQDGAAGGVDIARSGGSVLAQDQATSVVWGMPGATAQSGCCAAVLPLDQIGGKINRILKGQPQ